MAALLVAMAGKSAMLNHGGAGCVPGIDEDERLRGVMQLKQA